MRAQIRVLPGFLVLVCLALAVAAAAEPAPLAGGVNVYLTDGRKLPLYAAASADVPVARVGSETIAVRELGIGLAGVHEHAAQSKVGKKDFRTVLDRLVDARLVALEARAMGIDQLPEYRKQLEAFRSNTLRELVKAKLVEGLGPDPKQVDKLYREAVREWKVRSLRFTAEEDARAFVREVKAGGSFDALAQRAVAEKKAEATGEGQAFPEKQMLPEVLAEVRKLSPGGVSPAIKVDRGFAVVRLVGEHIPDNPAERANAHAAALAARQTAALQAEYNKLVLKYAVVDRKLLKQIDLEKKKPGIEALMKDRRPLVRIQGEQPITVGDMATEVRMKYFHGVERAAKERQLNPKKDGALEQVMARRLFEKDARVRKIEDTPEFKHQLRDFENGALFGAAVERALVPDVKVPEADEKAYYQQHKADFTWPRFLRLEGMAFGDSRAAEAALKKLRAGTDFKWFAANAEGRLDPERTALRFDETPLNSAQLPSGLARSLSGAGTGDWRLHVEGSEHYVLHVLEEIPPRLRPLEQVRDEVRKGVFAEKLSLALRDWTAKLRKSYPVEVLVARIGE